MSKKLFSQSSCTLAAMALATVLTSTSALAADKSKVSDAERRYQEDRAICMKGKSNQDRATCLREAGAARTEAQRGGLDAPGGAPAPYVTNEARRCDELPAKERDDCLGRVKGDRTTTSGSVAAGGILKERVTREPGVPPSPVKADSDARDAPAR